MKLRNEFSVPAPVERAWAVLLDVERVAPCLPGAALGGGDGKEYAGTMTIKIGPVTSAYEGTVRIEEADDDARRAVLRAEARDARGAGTAAATITTEMERAEEGTRVLVDTDLKVSGPAAQFGRGVMQDVSGKLMGQFAANLAEEIAADPALARGDAGGEAHPVRDSAVGPLPAGPAGDAALAAARSRPGGGTQAAPRARPRRAPEVLDVGAVGRAAILRRVVPVAGGVAAVATLVWAARRSTRRGRIRVTLEIR